jgi:arylsulfatase
MTEGTEGEVEFMKIGLRIIFTASWLMAGLAVGPAAAQAPAAAKKPNILVIWGDDIGLWNVSAYNQGMMGYRTPNIDRIAKEGALFTDWYGQQNPGAAEAAWLYHRPVRQEPSRRPG